jgi:hypothetical protein
MFPPEPTPLSHDSGTEDRAQDRPEEIYAGGSARGFEITVLKSLIASNLRPAK